MITRTFAALALVLSSPAAAQGTDPLVARWADSLVADFQRRSNAPGVSVALVRGGRPVLLKGYGVATLGTSRATTPSTIYHMASVTKPFVATAIMQLVERGRVALDSPVTAYLPYFRIRGGTVGDITIRRLLNHTAGMPDVSDYAWNRPEYEFKMF